ncbi:MULTISPECIES: hypothetical protein [unclassified Aminobacter]|uniref:hypothetical protein n=1 Tax=unclassified Aminobacter TaxID=2644704 RepID=UPI0004648CDC|nr:MULTISPECIES: hypothetical protein [unclassified Aminobacter]TWH24522.1 hypothetical protein L611_000700001340 [Aminobacter sp. J15]
MSRDSAVRQATTRETHERGTDKAEPDQRLLLQKIRTTAASGADFTKVDELVRLYRANALKAMVRRLRNRLSGIFGSEFR